jgi:hypothetical protein
LERKTEERIEMNNHDIKIEGNSITFDVPELNDIFSESISGRCRIECPVHSLEYDVCNLNLQENIDQPHINGRIWLCYPGPKCPRYAESKALQKAWKEKNKKE